MHEADLSFRSMGTTVRIIVGPRTHAAAAPPGERAERLRGWIEAFDRRLSRFRPDS
jgi:hypothetical protein